MCTLQISEKFCTFESVMRWQQDVLPQSVVGKARPDCTLCHKNVSTFHQTMAALALFSLYPCKEEHDNHKVWWASKTWLYIVSPTCLHSSFFFHQTMAASALFSYILKNPLKLWCARPNPFVHLCHQNVYTSAAFIKQQWQLLDLINIIANHDLFQ